jgi:hypothetical protein
MINYSGVTNLQNALILIFCQVNHILDFFHNMPAGRGHNGRRKIRRTSGHRAQTQGCEFPENEINSVIESMTRYDGLTEGQMQKLGSETIKKTQPPNMNYMETDYF